MAAPELPALSLLHPYRGTDFQPLYTTAVTVRGGVSGHGRASGVARSDDGCLALELRLPRALGGAGGGTNPEQLFAAGYAACFHGALRLLAQRARIRAAGATVQATVAFGRDPVDGAYALTARLQVRLPGLERAAAEALVRDAERLCPYAKMVRNGLAGTITLVR
ncbi:Ohr family peroxiredoxin [Cupriavidus respiraculi]|uniref:Organic hydroperoxide resistance protein OhrB n=1 Tax=Cupriavidus respiraculi TaxID=195930 RepID=A0ABM8WHH6_9BURK|nr:Ohr family peroxiredoxin [Cupriavidus respiraculi]CAG9166851.1 Organic hydroperoxide resistance protein OhrB [Cupriavidus respiraculi]